MKKIFVILFLFVLSSAVFSQEKQHLPLSKSLVGIWQWIASDDGVGKLRSVRSQTENRAFKVINSDGTFYTLMFVPGMYMPVVTFYGTYELAGTNKYYENVVQNAVSPHISGTRNELRYSFEEDGKVLVLEYRIEGSDRWSKEAWGRVFYQELKTEKNSKIINEFEKIEN